ncbi:heme-binding protein [Polynucleobacter sp. AM-26B4]|uniref:SOUL family heme-binding protein n=1 Tax=Polynucleobacter sp. AM-26B4 TaxID=2689103 RepID=UPI002102F6AF|nr:heme-binding protein [Polynucleobacter sp. AM-26B4]
MLIKQASKLFLGFAALSVLMGGAMANEEPRYEVIKKEENFEVRRYQPMIIAEVLVAGALSEASNKGFRQIADFIFGNNEDPIKKQSEKIAMTAPVTMEADTSSKIAMTAPVTMEGSGGAWKMAFVMPSKFTMETLPKPKNPNITIKQIPTQQLAVVTFSGWVDEEKLAAQTTRLNEWMAKNGLKSSGSAQLSRYNPPWTLPFWRRNEVWMKLD